MRRLIAGSPARDRVARPLPQSNRGRGRARAQWSDGVSRAEATPEDLHALANLAEPWNIREDHDPARDQADARAEVAALIRAAMLSRAEAEVISMVVRGVTVTGIARARGVTHQAVRLALALAIGKMAAPPPPTPAPRVMLSTLSKKKSSARARA
jgi:hypothetical protein